MNPASSAPAVSSVIASLSALPNFDPRAVPVAGVDDALPPVPAAALAPAALRARFAQPPAWTPEVRVDPRLPSSAREPTRAAVLVPIVLRDAGPTVLLTERTAHLSNHSGQVAFPGGRADPGDRDAAATALRETMEEVGIAAAFIDVLGHLSTYVTGTAFVVTPVVGLVRADYEPRPNAYEVADMFEVPLEFLMNPAHHRRHVLDTQGMRREWFSMPYQDGGRERFIWGATAGMLRNLYRFLSA
ncbi:CoA pyrophosphatase [Ramlibacter sp. H39-3-26]|uniref:CoA pyrophosphatase n=1 Tax=Curvibacter soli TaxID=3031331 RepID=UPI0023DA8571|nr:CoA pyrophosphatase [Ramlibacter sp. H39-3-26]MDF1486144.1 CoA pyrophosphatase [Ramlibacter sp. H39-3-26]